MLSRLTLQQPITHASNQKQPQEHANARAEICKSNGRRGKVVVFHEDEGEGRVKKVQNTIYESSVDCHEAHNRRVYKHLERPDQSTRDELLV